MVSIKNSLLQLSLSSLLLISCADRALENDIIELSEQSCSFSNERLCNLNLAALTGQNVDSIVVFDAETSSQDISRVLGLDYNTDKAIADETKRVFFLFDGKVTREGDVRNNRIIFVNDHDSLYYFCRIYRNPNFNVERISDSSTGKRVYSYLLTYKTQEK